MSTMIPNGQISPDPFDEAVAQALGLHVTGSRTLGGGTFGEVRRVELDDGTVVVAKYSGLPEARFDLEAGMLLHLRSTGVVPVPEVYAAGQHLLVMEFMPGYPMGPSAEPRAGALLAALHDVTNDEIGFAADTLNGSLVLANPPGKQWIPFFRDHRLRFAAEAATSNGSLPAALGRRIEAVASRLDDLLTEPARPTLLHGDLWAGNILADRDRITAFIDPSICYGHPELELAHAATFGGFGPPLFDSYEAHRPIDREFWTLRRHVYALYPALIQVYYRGDRFLPLLDSTLGMTGV